MLLQVFVCYYRYLYVITGIWYGVTHVLLLCYSSAPHIQYNMLYVRHEGPGPYRPASIYILRMCDGKLSYLESIYSRRV